MLLSTPQLHVVFSLAAQTTSVVILEDVLPIESPHAFLHMDINSGVSESSNIAFVNFSYRVAMEIPSALYSRNPNDYIGRSSLRSYLMRSEI
jgi:hypothetical protein